MTEPNVASTDELGRKLVNGLKARYAPSSDAQTPTVQAAAQQLLLDFLASFERDVSDARPQALQRVDKVRPARGADADVDAALVTRAQAEDAEAFDLLYRRWKRDVWTLSYYLLQRNHHEAEEAMQETFLKAWRNLHRCPGSEPPRSWILAICRNVCIDRVRRSAVEPPAYRSAALDDAADAGPSEPVALHVDLDELKQLEREAWYLIDVLGYSSTEASHVVGAPSSTIRSRVARARAQLAKGTTKPQLAKSEPDQTDRTTSRSTTSSAAAL